MASAESVDVGNSATPQNDSADIETTKSKTKNDENDIAIPMESEEIKHSQVEPQNTAFKEPSHLPVTSNSAISDDVNNVPSTASPQNTIAIVTSDDIEAGNHSKDHDIVIVLENDIENSQNKEPVLTLNALEADNTTSQLPSRSPSVSHQSASSSHHLSHSGSRRDSKESKESKDLELGITESEKKKEFSMTIELPRDILTGYIIIRLTGTWDKLSGVSRVCILFGFIFSWFAQFTVFASLITQTIEEFVGDFRVSFSGQDFLFNLVALCALFMYLWKDVMAYYNSVWFYVSLVEKERSTGLGTMFGAMSETLTTLDTTRMAVFGDLDQVSALVNFGKFRLLMIMSFVLDAGFGLYSLVEIAATDSGITDKLEVAIQIFFVLEIDDWACELFILRAGVLDDEQFDVSVTLDENDEDHAKSVEKNLKWITGLLACSIMACYAMSFYHVSLKEK